jgi:hypothetical protein
VNMRSTKNPKTMLNDEKNIIITLKAPEISYDKDIYCFNFICSSFIYICINDNTESSCTCF